MAEDLIRYDLLVQDALRGVVRKVLGQAVREGLKGDHHFYISFRTDLPGVRVSQRLRDKYPQEMTIVLQHQFWDLGVTEHTFEVGLSFEGIPDRLLIPFDALTGFFDPSVQFGLKFEVEAPAASEPAPAVRPLQPAPAKIPAATGPAPVPASPAPLPAATSPKPPALPAAEPAKEATKPATKRDKAPAEEAPEAAPGAQVVSLDAFRKKN